MARTQHANHVIFELQWNSYPRTNVTEGRLQKITNRLPVALSQGSFIMHVVNDDRLPATEHLPNRSHLLQRETTLHDVFFRLGSACANEHQIFILYDSDGRASRIYDNFKLIED